MRATILALLWLAALSTRLLAQSSDIRAIVSVPDQRLAVVENGYTIARFPSPPPVTA